MRFPVSFSLILSQVRAFIQSAPTLSKTPARSGMSRCDSRERLARLEDMERGETCPLVDPERIHKEEYDYQFGYDTPVSVNVDLMLQAAPLVLLGGLVNLGNN